MPKQNGFTLIELMVVISIIAMLMAILMPALASSKQQAKAVACQSTLSQWGKVFMMYTMDNDGYFASGSSGKMWTTFLKPYYIDTDLHLCPMAAKPASEAMGIPNMPGSKFLAWGKFDPNDPTYIYLELGNVYGSYGMNGRVSNEPPNTKELYGDNPADNWRSCDVRGANNIPLFLDCTWLGALPTSFDEPPQYEGECLYGPNGPDIKAFCLDRHNGYINGLFVDFSVRKVGLKQLWKLKWHRQFDISADPPVWPSWMRNFKDF